MSSVGPCEGFLFPSTLSPSDESFPSFAFGTVAEGVAADGLTVAAALGFLLTKTPFNAFLLSFFVIAEGLGLTETDVRGFGTRGGALIVRAATALLMPLV